ncbi:MAG: hypothetical protein WD625_04545, partial [Balneolales bacterium]
MSFFLFCITGVKAQSETHNADSEKASSRTGMGYILEYADSLRRYKPRSHRVPNPFKRKRANLI